MTTVRMTLDPATGALHRGRRPAGDGAPAPVMPADVRLMNAVTAAVALVLVALALAAVAAWAMRQPAFTLRAIQIDGDVSRNSVPTLRANAAPRLAGNFFTIDLAQARAAFEGVPWVRRAVVHRVWPDRLRVTLEEHQPAALWQGEDGNDRLVNSFGEVFDANVGDVEDEGLPRLAGPPDAAPRLLALYRRLAPVVAALDARIEVLSQSGRGSFAMVLDSGAEVALGRGSDDELLARTERFVRTLPQVAGRWGAPLESADLRHADGYAVRLAGVTTGVAAAASAAAPGN